MIVITGAAGLIGSNLIKKLNRLGYFNILAVDDLTDGAKFRNLVGCQISDYLEKDDFLALIQTPYKALDIEVIFHQGACSATTEWNGRYLVKNNYEYSKSVYEFCTKNAVPLIYASSASVYGLQVECCETAESLRPLNPYGYSKLLFDNYVSQQENRTSQIVGLRYFNVYGPGESHKGDMASVIFHFYNQLVETGKCRLFGDYDGFLAGTQSRDFIYVEDIVDINIWMWKNPHVSGVFNCGTGASTTFNAIAQELISYLGSGEITYVDFPESLKGCYQSRTCADIKKLRSVGYIKNSKSITAGIRDYMKNIGETAKNRNNS